jgi:hypothetical protein
MAKYVPDADSYAPVTVLVDARPDGVHLSYDRMASFLAPYAEQNLFMRLCVSDQALARVRSYEAIKITDPSPLLEA